MAAEYHSINLRFNMLDPTQARAWDLLQNAKSTKTYAEHISEAIIQYYHNKPEEICLDEASIKCIADAICKRLNQTGIAVMNNTAMPKTQKKTDNIAEIDEIPDAMLDFLESFGE